MIQNNITQRIIHQITQINDLQSLQEIQNAVDKQIKKSQLTSKVLYLIDKGNDWYIVTPKFNGQRKSIKIGPKLNKVQTIQQTMLEAPMEEDETFTIWQKWNRLANLKRTLKLGLTVEAAAKLEDLELRGFVIKLP